MLPPLVVDLDGTLIHTDMLHESAMNVFREKPWAALRIPVWLAKGKAVVKEQLAHRSQFNPVTLPYNKELLAWLREQKQAGRRLILCTASDQRFAVAIARHLDIFDEVLASDGQTNLSGAEKADALTRRFGDQGFDYAGNSVKDLPVWAQARRAVVVNAPAPLIEQARQCCDVEQVFAPPPTNALSWLKVVRAHQWLKNLLLFIPILAAHDLGDTNALWSLLLAFWAFNFCASSVYITNDLLDLESDRLHPRKQLRPFASGTVAAWRGVILIPFLLFAAVLLGMQAGGEFMIWLGVYFVVTCAYSFGLKRLILVDCLTLAMLYTLRIVAGAAAAGTELTFWLLAESIFLFLSLAFVKRYAELRLQSDSGAEKAHGRGYLVGDAPLIQTLGITSGFIAVLVLALYLNSEAVINLYPNAEIVWATIPFMLFWVSWMWMQANRGHMHDDPLVFAVKDRASLLAGTGFALALLLASMELPW